MAASSAVAQYHAQFDARADQDARFLSPRNEGEDRWARGASRFRRDPRREMEPDLAIVAGYVQPDDILLDVGGGAGRFSLPLALRCREVITIEPSPAMGAEFEAARQEAGIANARLVPADWLSAPAVTGDLALVAHVTYFVRDIEPFLRRLAAAARRRVLILVDAVPPPDRNAPLFTLLFGEERQRVPGFRELLPALWELGIIPEVRRTPGQRLGFATREQALESAVQMIAGTEMDPAEVRTRVAARLDDLLVQTPTGFTWRDSANAPGLLITWETGGASGS